MSVEVVQRNVGYHLEGPHWDHGAGTLLYVDIIGKTVHRYNPRTGKAISVNVGTMGYKDPPAGLDERGTLDRGALYCLHPDKSLVTHLQNVGISNGLAWTADKKTMYYIDSFKYGVDAFDYDIESGNICNRRQVISIPGRPERFPDGMCIDSEDMLWVAYFNGGSVRRYNPQTGEMLREIKLPAAEVITSCCWGGANLDELYVTSSKLFLTSEQLKIQDAAGSILRVTGLGVKGVKGELFNDLL